MLFIMRLFRDPQESWQLVRLHRNLQLVHVQITAHKLKQRFRVSCLGMLFNDFSTLDHLDEPQLPGTKRSAI